MMLLKILLSRINNEMVQHRVSRVTRPAGRCRFQTQIERYIDLSTTTSEVMPTVEEVIPSYTAAGQVLRVQILSQQWET
jgi:hypothetical protein